MNGERTVTFKLNGKRPDEFTIERLAQYLRVLGELVGNADKVRVTKISPGSVRMAMVVEPTYYPKFVERVTSAKNPALASGRIGKIVDTLQEMVTDDRVTAEVTSGKTKLFYIRGYSRAAGTVIGPVIQRYTVRGRLIGLEGKDATKHARIAEYGTSREIHGEFREDELAERLRQHLWGEVVEIAGTARLFRHADGKWEIKAFRIDSVLELESDTPTEFVGRLRQVFSGLGTGAEAINQTKKLRS